MANLVKTFLLGELVKGLGVTLKNFFARKDTIYFPEEKTPQSVRSAACTRNAVIRTAKSAVLRANCVRRCVRQWRLTSNRKNAKTAPAAPSVTTST